MPNPRLQHAMRSTGGVARYARLRDAGISRHELDRAVRAGEVERVRRGWFAAPGADATLVEAARAAVVVTCVSQARRLGLWVHEEPTRLHVGASRGSSGARPGTAHVHWSKPLIPRHPDALVDPLENVLALVAECEPYERALATWESALNKNLITSTALAGFALRPAARRVLAESWQFSDAGLETYLRTRLRWMRLPLTFQIWVAGHRVDALVGARLAVQVDGGTHVGAQRSEDIRHDAELKLMNFHVIRVSYPQVMFEWHIVQDLIMRAVAQGLHEGPRN